MASRGQPRTFKYDISDVMRGAELDSEHSAKDIWKRGLAAVQGKNKEGIKPRDFSKLKQKEAGRFWELVERTNEVQRV